MTHNSVLLISLQLRVYLSQLLRLYITFLTFFSHFLLLFSEWHEINSQFWLSQLIFFSQSSFLAIVSLYITFLTFSHIFSQNCDTKKLAILTLNFFFFFLQLQVFAIARILIQTQDEKWYKVQFSRKKYIFSCNREFKSHNYGFLSCNWVYILHFWLLFSLLWDKLTIASYEVQFRAKKETYIFAIMIIIRAIMTFSCNRVYIPFLTFSHIFDFFSQNCDTKNSQFWLSYNSFFILFF